MDQEHGTPVGPRVRKYIYVFNKRRVMTSTLVATLMIIVMLYLIYEVNILDHTEHVQGEVTAKFDNRDSIVYSTVWLEVNGERWSAWDIIDDYEVGDELDAHLEPWCDPLVSCNIMDLVVFGFILACIVGVLGACIARDKIEVKE